MKKRGMLILFEGAPSTGKTTHAKNLTRILQQHGYDAIYRKMSPTENFIGRTIIKLRRFSLPYFIEDPLYGIDDFTESREVDKQLNSARTVVMDKSIYNLQAFWNTFRSNIYSSLTYNLVNRLFQNPVPDLTFLLKTEYQERIRRVGIKDPNSRLDKLMLAPEADNKLTKALEFYIKQHYRNIKEVNTTTESIENIDTYLTNIVLEEMENK